MKTFTKWRQVWLDDGDHVIEMIVLDTQVEHIGAGLSWLHANVPIKFVRVLRSASDHDTIIDDLQDQCYIHNNNNKI